MGLDGCGKFIKFTMFGANFLILLGGIAVFSVGVWTCADHSSFEELVGSDLYMSAAYILIVTGIIVVIISFMGCFGAFREIKCLLVAYFITLLLIFIIMIVGGVLGLVFKGQVEEKMKDKMKSSAKEYETSANIRDVWDTVQDELKCCGMSTKFNEPFKLWSIGRKDVGEGKKNDEGKVPKSCCMSKVTSNDLLVAKCNDRQSLLESVYPKDCYIALKEIVIEHAKVIAGVGIGIACILIIGMIFSLLLCCMIE